MGSKEERNQKLRVECLKRKSIKVHMKALSNTEIISSRPLEERYRSEPLFRA